VYHPNHFTCQGCGINLVGTQFKEAGGEAYCGECKKNLQLVVGTFINVGSIRFMQTLIVVYLPSLDPTIHICAKCKKPIIGEYILLFGQRMHPEVRSFSSALGKRRLFQAPPHLSTPSSFFSTSNAIFVAKISKTETAMSTKARPDRTH